MSLNLKNTVIFSSHTSLLRADANLARHKAMCSLLTAKYPSAIACLGVWHGKLEPAFIVPDIPEAEANTLAFDLLQQESYISVSATGYATEVLYNGGRNSPTPSSKGYIGYIGDLHPLTSRVWQALSSGATIVGDKVYAITR